MGQGSLSQQFLQEVPFSEGPKERYSYVELISVSTYRAHLN